jgi:phage tail sheath protein FI
MASTYKTPGVYIEEIATLPRSVAEVATAVPAYMGYTERGPEIGRISSLLDFEQLFGGAHPTPFTVTTTATDGGPLAVDAIEPEGLGLQPLHQMHYCLRAFFANGGGSCYVARAGDYDAETGAEIGHYEAALDRLRKEDEPTLIVLVGAQQLGEDLYHSLCQAVLKQCAELGDRFAILDGPASTDEAAVSAFRSGIGTTNLAYGAVYVPSLLTAMTHHYDPATVVIGAGGDDAGETLASIESTETGLYNQIRAGLARIWVELPPAAAVAGVYAQVDATRGVWKAPANVSVASVISPTTKISDAEQESLNVDPTAGKSINAIRSFTGRGTLVWGARTLAGNDNEWRYVPVRRLFNMIEESASKSTGFAVFEPNDATTWLKVKGMIESFLFNLWERGALAGPTPEAAYFVDIGLGKTMTADDVLNGRMIVRVGVAAVRPAEFIVLEFTHKLQEA